MSTTTPVEMSSARMEASPSDRRPINLRLFAIIHEHRHGVDVYHVLAEHEPEPARVVAAFGSSYEPDCEESAEVREVNLHASTLRPSADRDEAGFFPVS